MLEILLGFIAGGIIPALITWINRHYDDKKYRREAMINIALEKWKLSIDYAEKRSQAGQSVTVLPLDAFIIGTFRLFDALMDKDIDMEKIRKAYRESQQIEELLTKEVWKKDKQ